MAKWQPPKWCTSRHPERPELTCELLDDHRDDHLAESGPPLDITQPDGSTVTQAQIVSWP